MDDLISRKETLQAFDNIPTINGLGLEPLIALRDVKEIIKAVPKVDAVPLDKLCEWLNVHCGRPNDCANKLCGKCDLDGEGFEYETCWETLLIEWMEEQNA